MEAGENARRAHWVVAEVVTPAGGHRKGSASSHVCHGAADGQPEICRDPDPVVFRNLQEPCEVSADCTLS